MIANWIKNNKGFMVITLIYVLAFVLMLPLRNQAFDDDFAYILTVENFIKTGKLEIVDWSAVSMIFQAYAGLIASKIFGYSTIVLQLTNIISLYFGLIGFYFLLKGLGLDEKRSTIFSLILLVFPFTLQYTYSFMSDTFYLTYLIISLSFYVAGVNKNSTAKIFLGSVFAAITFLIRQIAIVIPIAFLLVYLYRLITSSSKFNLKILLAGLIPFVLAAAAYNYWLSLHGLTVAQYMGVQIPAQNSINNNIVRFFWPEKAPVISRDFIDFFIQRPTGYFTLIFGFLGPYFLIFKIKIKNQITFLFHYKKEVVTTIAVFTFFMIANYITGSKFTTGYPLTRLLIHSKNLNWMLIWPILVKASIPLWILTIAVALNKSLKTLFARRKNKLTKSLFIWFIVSLGVYIVRIIQMNNPSVFKHIILLGKFDPKSSITFFLNFPRYVYLIIKEKQLVLLTLGEVWLYLAVLLCLFTVVIILTTAVRYKKIKTISSNLIFIFLVFAGSFFITIFLANYYWINYVIQFIPFAIVFFAYTTRNLEVSIIRAVFVIGFFFLVSLEIVSNRYHIEGKKWEIATQLVEAGVEPQRIINVNWAWNPYWYFESSFQEQVNLAGGDKYKINFLKLGSWPVVPPKGTVYELTTSDLESKPYKTINVSEEFRVFTTKYKIITITYEME